MPLTVSVNLSARQFYRDDLAQRISEIVQRRGLRAVVDRARSDRDEPAARPRRDPQGAASAARRRLHRRDRRLRHRLLVADAPEALPDRHAEDRHLVHRRSRDRPAATRRSPRRSSASRAASGLKVVAEGVGTREQLEFLDVRGCHCFQGYWVSKPLPADAFVEFVAKRPQVNSPRWRRAAERLAVTSRTRASQASLRSASRGICHSRLQHQHVREARQDRRRRRRDAARSPARRPACEIRSPCGAQHEQRRRCALAAAPSAAAATGRTARAAIRAFRWRSASAGSRARRRR